MKLDLLKNEINKIKNSNNSDDIVTFKIDYNFSEDIEIDNFLKKKSIELFNTIGNGNLKLGKIFEEVKEYLNENENDESISDNNENESVTYCKWLTFNGFNRMTALRYRNRYKIFKELKSEDSKRLISIVPQRIIDDLTKLIKNNKNEINKIDSIKEIKDLENLVKILIEDKTESNEEEIKESKAIHSLFKSINNEIKKNNIRKVKNEVNRLKNMIIEIEKNIKIHEEKKMNDSNLKLFLKE